MKESDYYKIYTRHFSNIFKDCCRCKKENKILPHTIYYRKGPEDFCLSCAEEMGITLSQFSAKIHNQPCDIQIKCKICQEVIQSISYKLPKKYFPSVCNQCYETYLKGYDKDKIFAQMYKTGGVKKEVIKGEYTRHFTKKRQVCRVNKRHIIEPGEVYYRKGIKKYCFMCAIEMGII